MVSNQVAGSRSAAEAAAGRVVSPVLVGRDTELGLAVRAVLAAPAVVALEGEAGIGKTRLVTELLARPELTGLHGAVGRCHPIREAFPLGPVVEAVLGVAELVRGRQWSPLVGALRPLLLELSDSLPPAPEPLDDRAAERHRVFRGLVELLTGLGQAVLVLEDLHWADDQTVDFITYLTSDPPPELAVVLTFRSDEASTAVRALAARLPADVTRLQLTLPWLDEDRTGGLVAAILDTETVSSEFAAYLWERTSGLPLAIEEVLALVRARGLVVQQDGRWERKELDDLEVPAGIREPTLERISRLPDGVRRLAEAAAVVQRPAEPDVLMTIAGTGSPEEIDLALGSGLLTEYGGRVGFRHLLAAKSVYDDLSGARRAELHGRVADAIAGSDPVPLGQAAHHLRSAGRLPEWAEFAERAAAQAVALGNDEEARRLLDEVLRTVPLEPDRRARLAVTLGRAAIETAQAHTVVALLTDVVDQAAGATRGEVRLVLAGALNQTGADIETQVRLLVGAADDLTDRPDLRAEALVGAGVLAPSTVPHQVVLERFEEAMRLAAELGDPVLETWVLSKVGAVLCTHGDPAWREPAERMLSITRGVPRLRREVRAHWTLAVSACWSGQLAMAERLLDGCRSAPATQENKRLETIVRSGEALLSFCRGAWNGLADEVAGLSEELTGALAEVGLDVHVVAACLALAAGRTEEADRRLAEVLEAAERLDDLLILPTAVAMSARVGLARGDTEPALGRVRRLLSDLEESDNLAPVARLVPAAVDLLVDAGQVGEARALVDRIRAHDDTIDAPLVPPALRYARGVLDGAAGELLAAAAGYDVVPAPYEAGLARERAAEQLLGAGDSAAATPPLRAAVETYDRLGANWDRRRAASLARTHGIGLPAVHRGGHRGYGQELSPREREVAGLAAAGRTNKEIAAELYLSTNTVEKHLGAALRKLQLRSRTELAGRWDARDGEDGGLPH